MDLYLRFFLSLLMNAAITVILLRVILSWVWPHPTKLWHDKLNQFTDRFLQPLRRFIPPVFGLDLTPAAAILILVLLKEILYRL